MRYVYLATEGPHDVELIGRLLKPRVFKRIQKAAELDPFWKRLVPSTFPHDGDLLRRVPVPLFLASQDCSVAIYAAGGLSKLASAVRAAIANLSEEFLSGIGILLDSDEDGAPLDRHLKLCADLAGTITLPMTPGLVSRSAPRAGVFILPDNAALGTLEDLLLECAGHAYPSLLQRAASMVSSIEGNSPELRKEDLQDLQKPSGRKKATVAAMSAVLKPGKAVQVSIQDNRWLEGSTLALPRITALRAFLDELLGFQA
jgi:hypothetical protein